VILVQPDDRLKGAEGYFPVPGFKAHQTDQKVCRHQAWLYCQRLGGCM